ncbi:squamous cell carcinoma antigen recognized by T-cells 3 isoform X1 [Diorhabda carinulata]|uniref:squamous cell carcinoma antigen recognized by T-cells 3 isoform X1 n=1 Tax=Diorhabda carinulata TaxID=1163345 RepID=UPI0025A15E89|nr:squamous cell carcinoma antigen recognized by T-cells 3 isoform X1 [Diorhabda carinulata]
MNMDPMEEQLSSDSSDVEDGEQELVKRAEYLEASLLNNKYLYDEHIEVIKIYRDLAELNSMRDAYRRFHQCFPLTPKIWLEWIRDEMKIANIKDEQKNVLDLFEKAVQDYLAVELWVEYAQYSLKVNGLEYTRNVLEKGLTFVGLHVSEGSLLWDTLREIEYAHISLHKENSPEWFAQVKRLADVFKRQLSVPLLNMENTYQEWTDWYKTLPDGLIESKPLELGYQKALKILEVYKPFEEKILNADSTELYDVYKEYINNVKDTSTIICLYERVVLPLCLTPDIWEDYIKFTFKLKDVVLRITNRAIRNCTWSEKLWIARIRALEFHKMSEDEILSCFEEGLTKINPSPAVEFWQSFLEYYHRNCEDHTKLTKLFLQASEQITPDSDPTFKLTRWYARVLAKRGDMESVRKLWSNIMSHQQSKESANTWCEYANLEKQYGTPKNVRNIFNRALASCKEWSLYILEEWLMFEREVGSLEDIIRCEDKRNHLYKTINQSTPTNGTSEVTRANKKRSHEGDTGSFKKRRYEQDTGAFKKKRREEDTGSFEKWSQDTESRFKKKNDFVKPTTSSQQLNDKNNTVFVSNLHPAVNEEKLKEIFPNALNIHIVLDKHGKSRCFGYIHFSQEEECRNALAKDRVPINGRPVFVSEFKSKNEKDSLKNTRDSHQNILFIKDIPLTKTKEDLEGIFKSYEPVEVRLIYKRNGESKGIAYVEFKTPEEAQNVLKKCQSLTIDGNEVLVAISEPPKKKPTERSEKLRPVRHVRLEIPLIPRALLIKPSKKNENKNTENEENN